MKLKSKILIITTIVMFNSLSTIAQLQVLQSGQNSNPDNLVRNVLLGEGVKIISVNYFGDSTTQVGYFTDINGTIIGLDSGIVMSTGNLIEIDPSFTNQPHPAVDVFDSDLLTVANQVFNILAISNVVDTVRHSSVIEFEFV